MTDVYAELRLPNADATVFKYLTRATGDHALAKVPRKVLIACSARSGSTLLKECLEAYGVYAREYFNVEDIVRPVVERGEATTILDYANYLARTSVRNDTFAIKGNLPAFFFLYHIGELPQHVRDWRVLFIRRKNIVRQAISMELAKITGQWSSLDAPARQVTGDDYAFDSLDKNVETILRTNMIWERIFARFGIEPHRVFYEDLASDMAAVVAGAARFVGIEADNRTMAPRIARQSNVINDTWEERYLNESRRRLTA